jgi:hypothetical protein
MVITELEKFVAQRLTNKQKTQIFTMFEKFIQNCQTNTHINNYLFTRDEFCVFRNNPELKHPTVDWRT